MDIDWEKTFLDEEQETSTDHESLYIKNTSILTRSSKRTDRLRNTSEHRNLCLSDSDIDFPEALPTNLLDIDEGDGFIVNSDDGNALDTASIVSQLRDFQIQKQPKIKPRLRLVKKSYREICSSSDDGDEDDTLQRFHQTNSVGKLRLKNAGKEADQYSSSNDNDDMALLPSNKMTKYTKAKRQSMIKPTADHAIDSNQDTQSHCGFETGLKDDECLPQDDDLYIYKIEIDSSLILLTDFSSLNIASSPVINSIAFYGGQMDELFIQDNGYIHESFEKGNQLNSMACEMNIPNNSKDTSTQIIESYSQINRSAVSIELQDTDILILINKDLASAMPKASPKSNQLSPSKNGTTTSPCSDAFDLESQIKSKRFFSSDDDSNDENSGVIVFDGSISKPFRNVASTMIPTANSDENFETPSKRTPNIQVASDLLPLPKTPHKKVDTKFNKQRESMAHAHFLEFNTRVFGGKLPYDTEIFWSKTLNKTAGRTHTSKKFTHDGVLHSAKIELSSKVLDDADKLRNTLVHEMCHCAAWVFNHTNKPSHGPVFKYWGQLVSDEYPEMPAVTTCHSYEINFKFWYVCLNQTCQKMWGRHSKSIDVEKFGCGACGGLLRLMDRVRNDGTPVKRSAFADFMKTHYKSVKDETPGQSHAETMKVLGERYRDQKIYENGAFNQKFQVKGPFVKYEYKPNEYKEIGMIAGGSGITPI